MRAKRIPFDAIEIILTDDTVSTIKRGNSDVPTYWISDGVLFVSRDFGKVVGGFPLTSVVRFSVVLHKSV